MSFSVSTLILWCCADFENGINVCVFANHLLTCAFFLSTDSFVSVLYGDEYQIDYYYYKEDFLFVWPMPDGNGTHFSDDLGEEIHC